MVFPTDIQKAIKDAVNDGEREAENHLGTQLPLGEWLRFLENMENWVNDEMVREPITEKTLQSIREKARHLYEMMLIEAFI